MPRISVDYSECLTSGNVWSYESAYSLLLDTMDTLVTFCVIIFIFRLDQSVAKIIYTSVMKLLIWKSTLRSCGQIKVHSDCGRRKAQELPACSPDQFPEII